VFERFTDRARRVLVLAQEEARLLNHGFIGTEHILLGLLHERNGIAAQALSRMDVTLEAVREKVEELVGPTGAVPTGSPPFTPRAKKVLELSLREALQLGHNYIGTEHLLLGIVREGEGAGAQVLVSLGADQLRVRQSVIQLLADTVDPESGALREPVEMTSGSWTSRAAVGFRRSRIAQCSFCGRRPPESGRLIAGQDAHICEHCVHQWSDELSEDESADGE
jgi:ATP-dependent Clp protease ATP-binding subunit ClpC